MSRKRSRRNLGAQSRRAVNVPSGVDPLRTEHQRVIDSLSAADVSGLQAKMRDILIVALVEEEEHGGDTTLREVLDRATNLEDEVFFGGSF